MASRKILAVFGATGNQGGSVVAIARSDPLLSRTYKVRGITRSLSSSAALEMKDSVDELVEADYGSMESLLTALRGVHVVFAMTVPEFSAKDVYTTEYTAGKLLADAAVAAGVTYIIWSTLPPIAQLSAGKYVHAYHFDAKAAVEKYIRSLPIKSAFFCPAAFMANFETLDVFKPKKHDDGTFVLQMPFPPDAKWPWIDIKEDTGKFVGAILAEPERFEGQTFVGSAGYWSWEEVFALIRRATGKNFVYQQISLEAWRDKLGPGLADPFESSLCFEHEVGYCGEGTEAKIDWAIQHARGELTTWEQYAKNHPLQVD